MLSPYGVPCEVARGVAQIDEGVEALVHPGIEPLVRADDHGHPLVAQLVGQHPLALLPARRPRIEGDHRVLHALDRPLDARDVRIGIGIPLLAVVLHRIAHHPVGFLPLRRRRAVERVNQRAPIGARIPPEVRRGAEGEIPDAVRGEPPGERRRRRSAGCGRRRPASSRGDDGDRRRRAPRPGEPGALGGRQHLCGLSSTPVAPTT